MRDLVTGGQTLLFETQIVVWLWFTVLFANFAEAIAEGRGKAQAELAAPPAHRDQGEAAHRLATGRAIAWSTRTSLKVGDVVLVEAGDIIPSDGEVIEGIASVNEAAITGESAPVIRESGGDRSAVTGGTQVLSDWIRVRITAAPGSTFLDRMIKLVEGAERQKTPNEIALDILLVGLTIIFVFATVTIPSYAAYAGGTISVIILVALFVTLIPTTIGALLVGDRHRRHGPAGALQRARHVGPRRRGGGRRRHAAARQDRHHHARQPPGDRVPAGARRDRAGAGGRRPARLARRRDAGGPLDRRAGEGEIRHPRPRRRGGARQVHPVHRAEPHERRRPRRLVGAQGRGRTRSSASSTVRRRRRAPDGTVRALQPAVSAEAAREVQAIAETIAKAGGTPLAVAKDGKLLGVIHLKDIVKGGIRERFAELRRMGIRTIMITGDNPMTAAAIAAEAGVDDFLAQATPEDKLRLIRDEQAKGKLVAMCGDGTNDAPALAQADVGVAMNTGTQAAREAGNMVDLDSNPTKLIEIVEIGKQLLMTRGALTTFSIANDVAKYFAIIPAMFVAFYPQLQALNIMGLATPQSAILSAIIFNALIIIALIPLALKGVKYRPIGAGPLLQRNLLIYGLGGIIIPFIGIKAIDLLVTALHSRLRRTTMLREIRPAIVLVIALTLITGLVYPLAMTGIAGVIFPYQAQGSLIETGRQGGRLGADRPGVRRRQVLPRPAVGDQYARPEGFDQDGRRALQRRELGRLESRADQQGADRPRQGRRRQAQGREPLRAGADRPRHHLGQRARPGHLAGGGAVPGAARRQSAQYAGGARPRSWSTSTPRAGRSACSASRASTCCSSISPWMPPPNEVAAPGATRRVIAYERARRCAPSPRSRGEGRGEGCCHMRSSTTRGDP